MNEPRVVESVTNECQLLGRAHESSSARAEQLIACLEGEIAKRDARIEVQEAQIKILQSDANSWQSGYDEGLRMGAKHAAPVPEAKAQVVVMPERETELFNAAYGAAVESGWESVKCMARQIWDAARLAAAPAAPAADARLTESEWTKDAEEWGGALNYAAWEFTNECPEKSALLFNNTKGPLRAAIMKYAELVSASAKEPSHD